MAKISFVLVFALVLALPFHSVLGQDDSWKDLIGQGGFGGLSQETVDEAKKALDGAADAGAVADAAANAVGGPVDDLLGGADDAGDGASLTDWVSSAKDASKAPSSSPGSPANEPVWTAEADLFTDMVGDTSPTTEAPEAPEDNYPYGAPQSSSTKAPVSSPSKAPVSSPAKAPATSPSKAPVTSPTKAQMTSPTKAPVTSPSKAPVQAPTDAPVEGPAAGEEEEEAEWAPEGAPVESPLDDDEEEPVTVWPASPADAPPESGEGAALDELFNDVE